MNDAPDPFEEPVDPAEQPTQPLRPSATDPAPDEKQADDQTTAVSPSTEPPVEGNDETATLSVLDLMSEVDDVAPPDDDGPTVSAPYPPIVTHQTRDDRKSAPPPLSNLPPAATPPVKGRPDPPATPSGRTTRPSPPPIYPPGQRPSPPPPESDEEATRVQPRVAFPGRTQAVPRSTRPSRPSRPEPPTAVRVVVPETPAGALPRARRPANRDWTGCLIRAAVAGLFLALAGFALLMAGAVIGYRAIAGDLPAPSELRARASTFETARIYDRNGNLLYALADPNAGNRTFVPLDRIDQDLVEATIATEDARFYTNPGFDPIGIVRAIIQAAREREIVSGASTITQQLARALLLDEEERTQITFSRKVKEIILAAELSRTYEKNEILELYLNEIYYGNLAYGIEAAAETYFQKSAADLTLAEASLLAGLPQAPALWDPFADPESALGRQSQVLFLMVQEEYISRDAAQAALVSSAAVVRALEPPEVVIRHPHFIFTVLQQLEAAGDAQSIYRGGLRIFTTLDPATQRLAEETVSQARGAVVANGANNAALVALKPDTGEVLALVGSVDFNDEAIDGQVNIVGRPRQPGSSIKPLVYLAALEAGWTPATLIWDTETSFPNGANPPYVPKNYDDQFHGPLRLRPALGNSYNIPAVKALEFVGVCNFVIRMQALGLNSLQDDGCFEVGQPRQYGLALALGGGEITPLQMAGAYSILANQGRYEPPHTISRIENGRGELLFQFAPPLPGTNQVVRPEHAYLLTDILADNAARLAEFGRNNLLQIAGHRVAAKTGTSGTTRNDVRDAWTIGYSPHVVTAVWVGNTVPVPLSPGASGYGVASPIWHTFMTRFHEGRAPLDFGRPPNVVEAEICLDSGTRPGPDCSNRGGEIFAADQPPLPADQDLLRRVAIDPWTNQIATAACSESVFEATFFSLLVSGRGEVVPREQAGARSWLEATPAGRAWADSRDVVLPLRLPPTGLCSAGSPRPEAAVKGPQPNSQVTGEVEIRGTARGPNFGGYLVEYGLTHAPQAWRAVQPLNANQPVDQLLARWDTSGLSGPVTLRLTVFGPDNPYTPGNDPVRVESRIPLFVLAPTATPTPTPTATATASPTPTPSATPTATPIEVPGTPIPPPSATPTATVPAAATETVTATAVPSATSTPTPTDTPSP